MQFAELFDQICQEAPLPVMARSLLTHVFNEKSVDAIFRNHALQRDQTGLVPGYATRNLDGHHLEASHLRSKETRHSAAGLLPGVGLAVLDPISRLVVDYIPCEDAHAQERSLLPALIEDLEADQL